MKKKLDQDGEAKKVVKDLSAAQEKKLAECEEAIQENSKMYFLAGEALTQINIEQLYKAEFASFDSYCEGRWGFSGSHARRLMDSWTLVQKLRSGIPDIRDDELPQNEFQARLYMNLREEKHWVRSWSTVLKAAKERGSHISATLIREVCPKANGKSGDKKPHPKAKARFAKTDDSPRLEWVKDAISLVSQARVEADDYSQKDWIKLLDELEGLLESV